MKKINIVFGLFLVSLFSFSWSSIECASASSAGQDQKLITIIRGLNNASDPEALRRMWKIVKHLFPGGLNNQVIIAYLSEDQKKILRSDTNPPSAAQAAPSDSSTQSPIDIIRGLNSISDPSEFRQRWQEVKHLFPGGLENSIMHGYLHQTQRDLLEQFEFLSLTYAEHRAEIEAFEKYLRSIGVDPETFDVKAFLNMPTEFEIGEFYSNDPQAKRAHNHYMTTMRSKLSSAQEYHDEIIEKYSKALAVLIKERELTDGGRISTKLKDLVFGKNEQTEPAAEATGRPESPIIIDQPTQKAPEQFQEQQPSGPDMYREYKLQIIGELNAVNLSGQQWRLQLKKIWDNLAGNFPEGLQDPDLTANLKPSHLSKLQQLLQSK